MRNVESPVTRTILVRTPLRRIAAWLESEPGPVVRSLSRAVPLDPVRTVGLPTGAAVVGVGGATLGGSGRTPLAIALVEALSARGLPVALVGHGYDARVDRPRVVRVDDPVDLVGDEARIAAESLGARVKVIVAPTRETALRLAAEHAKVLVVDRLLQTRPRRLAYALLATPPAPCGAAFPFGDRVASSRRLRAAADEIVPIPGPDVRERLHVSPPLPEGARVALITSLARPSRARDALARLGSVPVVHVERPDHAPIDRAEHDRLAAIVRAHRVDAVVLDAKTRARLDEAAAIGAPRHVLRHAVETSSALVDRVVAAVSTALAVREDRC